MIFSKLWFLYNKTKQGDIYECPNLADVKQLLAIARFSRPLCLIFLDTET
jgi:hypothetical protein